MKIAIIEDQPAILELFTTVLELAGHRAYPYRTGTALVETLFTPQSRRAPLPYDLVIVDLYLPGTLSGLEVINSIHQRIPPETLPIILTSATTQSELTKLQAHLPTVAVLRKPFHLKDLLALIERRAASPALCSKSVPHLF